MANEAGYEAVDLNKKKLVEEVLVEERDDAIIRVAKMRKRQPPKLRSKARNIATNIINYYCRVSVKVTPSTDLHNHIQQCIENDFTDFINAEGSHNINMLSKAITECLADKEEQLKVRHQHLAQQTEQFSQSRRRGKQRFPYVASPHINNTDFIVDERIHVY
ncbi:hypothetical protein BsWGS_10432 [Bradybaena similaris]